MTQLLDKAIDEISKLSVREQDAIASIILDELLDEKEWDAAFDKSQEKLSKLAEKVRTDIREGRIRKMGFGRL
jgi:hypothetical protein